MKKLSNFFNNNLTHKILPLFALSLLVFFIFFVSNVQAVSADECGSFAPVIEEKIKSLPEYSSYDNYITVYWNLNNANRVIVVFFNGNPNLKFYIGEHNGLYALYANSSFDAFFYGIDSSSLNVISSYPQKCNGAIVDMYRIGNTLSLFPIFSNYDIYTNSSMTDYFYKYEDIVSYPYIYQDVGDIEYFISSSIDIEPRKL